MSKLQAEGVSAGYDKKVILHDVTVVIPEGRIVGLIGPNGSGKSTFLKALARILIPESGQVILDELPLASYPTKEIAQKIALLAQSADASISLPVKEVVSYGRFPYVKGFRQLSKEDHEIVAWALAATGLTELAEVNVNSLSGGQRQRVWIAMALAQDTDILILDEPTTYLDPAHQLEILNLLTTINREQGKTILLSIHDLNLASRFCDYLYGMKDGELLLQGTPAEVLTEAGLAELFAIAAVISHFPNSDKPLLLTYDMIKGKAGDFK